MPKKTQKENKRKSSVKKLDEFSEIKNQNKESRVRIKPKRRTLLAVIIILIIALAIGILALLNQFNLIENPFSNLNSDPELFDIRDECTLILGQLIHSIENEGVCELKCSTECGVRDLEFYDSEFLPQENNCHICRCYCN